MAEPFDQFEYDSLTERMVDSLPPWLNKNPDKNNHSILSGPGEKLEAIDAEIENIEDAIHVQTATTIGELAMLADMVDISPRENESLEHFRSRTIAEYQITSAQGDINGLINGVASFLKITNSSVIYSEDPQGGGSAQLTVPGNATSRTNLTPSEVGLYAEKLIAPSYRLDVIEQGTLKYVTPEFYSDTSDWSDTPGYTGLDADGNVKDGGGSYSGVIG